MQFVNNWQQPIALGIDDTEAMLDLPDGHYRLTATNADNTAHEIIDADVVEGFALLGRGAEGTDAQEWPAGSTIYNSITAETLRGLVAMSGNGPPTQAPLQAGQAYLDLDEHALWIATGKGLAEHWQLFSGGNFSGFQSVMSSADGESLAVQHSSRRIEVEAGPDDEPSSVALMLPAWQATPAGFGIEVFPKGDQFLTVMLDLSAIFSTADAEVYGTDMDSATTISRDGLEISIMSDIPFGIQITRISPEGPGYAGQLELTLTYLIPRTDFTVE